MFSLIHTEVSGSVTLLMLLSPSTESEQEKFSFTEEEEDDSGSSPIRSEIILAKKFHI